MSAIYRITDSESGAVYIGQAENAQERWKAHLWKLRHGRHHNRALQAAYNAHGAAALRLDVLEVLRTSHQFDRDARERAHILAAIAAGCQLMNVECVPGARRSNGWTIHERLLSQEPRPKEER